MNKELNFAINEKDINLIVDKIQEQKDIIFIEAYETMKALLSEMNFRA